MDSVLISFLATGACFGVPPLHAMLGTFSVDPGMAFALSTSAYYLACYPAAVLSLARGPRVAALLGCMLQVFAWALIGSNWTGPGFAVLGVGCRAVKEALLPVLGNRPRASTKQDLRLAFCTISVFHEMSPIVVHWLDQSRMTFFEPVSMTLQWLAVLLALLPFAAGLIAFLRLPNCPMPTGEQAVIFQEGRNEDVGAPLLWTTVMVHCFCSLRTTSFFASQHHASSDQFIGDPGGVLVFVEVAWMMWCIGGLICYPMFWLLLDKINASGMLLVTCLVSFIWSSLVDRGTFPNSAFALLFVIALKPLLGLTLMAVSEGHARTCQLATRHYAVHLSASGLLQLLLVAAGHWAGPRASDFILNGGIATLCVVCIVHGSTTMARPPAALCNVPQI